LCDSNFAQISTLFTQNLSSFHQIAQIYGENHTKSLCTDLSHNICVTTLADTQIFVWITRITSIMEFQHYLCYSAMFSLKNRTSNFVSFQSYVLNWFNYLLELAGHGKYDLHISKKSFISISIDWATGFFFDRFQLNENNWSVLTIFVTHISSYKSTQIYGYEPHKSQWPIKYTNFVWFVTQKY
jgi:hypothetical protein